MKMKYQIQISSSVRVFDLVPTCSGFDCLLKIPSIWEIKRKENEQQEKKQILS